MVPYIQLAKRAEFILKINTYKFNRLKISYDDTCKVSGATQIHTNFIGMIHGCRPFTICCDHS